MGPPHDLFHFLYLDDSLEPNREDPADEKLGVPNDLLDQLDWLSDLGSPQIPARVRHGGVLHRKGLSDLGSPQIPARVRHGRVLHRKLADEKLAVISNHSLDEFDLLVLDHIERDTYNTQVPKKPRWRPSGRRIWPLKPPPLAASNGVARESSHNCIHCLATDTPQWRAGPAGPATLCNACGIRFKSRRLLPEYRPLTSPTFADHLHSNRHKEVLKLREQFEIEND